MVAARFGRPRGAEGVRAVLDDGEGRLLFVRHSYGDRRAWELPGGRVHRGEAADEAVRREAREEVGADVAEWRALGHAESRVHRRRDPIAVFAARWPGGPVATDDLEIGDFAWLRPRTLPARLGPSSAAALALALAAPDAPAGAGAPGPSGPAPEPPS